MVPDAFGQFVTSSISLAGCSGKRLRAVATTHPGCKNKRGFANESAASMASPSRPVEVNPTVRPRAEAAAAIARIATVLPTFLPVPTTKSDRAPPPRANSKSVSPVRMRCASLSDVKDFCQNESDAREHEHDAGPQLRAFFHPPPEHAA